MEEALLAKIAATYKSRTGTNIFGFRDLQSFRGRIPRVPWWLRQWFYMHTYMQIKLDYALATKVTCSAAYYKSRRQQDS